MRKQFIHQNGSVLLESLIATVIFALGILGLVAVLANSTTNVNDTRSRDEVFVATQNAMNQTRLKKTKTALETVNSYLPNQAAFNFDRDGNVTQNSGNKEGECAGSVATTGSSPKDDPNEHLGPRDNNTKYISTTEITYGLIKTDGNTNKPRRLIFCAYRDDGPHRR